MNGKSRSGLAPFAPLEVPDTVPLFAPLRAGLVALLRSLEPADWDRPTVAGDWRVRDVVAHLLDGELRTLAAHRDAHNLAAGDAVSTYSDVVALIGRLNGEGVAAGRHLSARLLADLLVVTGDWMHAFLSTLDADAPALFAVAWAGEAESTNRFDTAREYTERWHHEMQIRSAIGTRGRPDILLAESLAAPLLDTAMRVLPHTYRDLQSADGTTIVVAVAERSWTRTYTLQREANAWRLYAGEPGETTARIAGSADAWWRLLFNALSVDEMQRVFNTRGTDALVAPLWRARSVMVRRVRGARNHRAQR